jgi:hypothetical protein
MGNRNFFAELKRRNVYKGLSISDSNIASGK